MGVTDENQGIFCLPSTVCQVGRKLAEIFFSVTQHRLNACFNFDFLNNFLRTFFRMVYGLLFVKRKHGQLTPKCHFFIKANLETG